MEIKEVWELILKELSGDITSEELDQLKTWVSASASNEWWYNRMRDPENINQFLAAMEEGGGMADESWLWIGERRKAEEAPIIKPRFRHTRYLRFVAAAAVVLAIVLPVTYRLRSDKQTAAVRDIAPGGDHATLTLGNGKVLILDSARAGMIAQQAGTKIVKVNSGQIAYSQASAEQAVLWNTIAVPRGGQYRLVLPDGSRVVLNSGSSLQFPSSFAGKERRVTLKGEGYFEVVHNAALPFKVTLGDMGGMEVAVLGTSFDIMAYLDEGPVKTTLLEGSVKVINGEKSAILTQDEVATADKDGAVQVAPADTSARGNAAWATSGMFYFNHADVKAVMRQISRWYSVDVEYGAGEFPRTTFSGLVGRDKSLAVVMEALKFYGINLKYEINGRKITVQP